ncbi:DUF4912 domain-containing protein [Spirochaetia bacterium]|nr:DUF4912 domain-containing protein [Spirochaetia bacterium]
MVEELPLDRPFLESVTTSELLKLADRAGIDLPPGLDRAIVIEELLETGEAVRSPPEDPGEHRGFTSPESITAPLPKHYNISYIDVLIRDPLWAFAFWEINAYDKETLEGAPDFGGYCLRVLSESGDCSFTVQVGTGDSAWYLGFPPEEGRFKVELCAMRKDRPVVLAVSKSFRMPTLPEPVDEDIIKTNPLLHLSGIADFNILRNTMRSSRLPKRSCAPSGGNAQ